MTKPIEKWAKFVWPADEIWRAVPGFKGYEVSDAGRIRSLRRGHAKLLMCSHDEHGYVRAGLYRDGKRQFHAVHRLVALVFIGPPPADRPICCHRDNDKRNNRQDNLRWDTQAGNIADKVIHGTSQIGSRHPRATIDEATAARIKSLCASSPRYTGWLQDIAKSVGCSYAVARQIHEDRCWRHV
jgi:hypothetical protein